LMIGIHEAGVNSQPGLTSQKTPSEEAQRLGEVRAGLPEIRIGCMSELRYDWWMPESPVRCRP
jgi:hypothetical protein